MIREAIPADIPRIVEMGRKFLLEGPYKDELADKPDEATKFAAAMLQHPNGHVLVAEEDDVVGVIAFIVMPHYFSGEVTATEMIWYCEPAARPGGIAMRLMWEAEKMARNLGATRMAFTAPIGPIGKLYERFGYRPIETAYQRSL